MHWLDSNTLAMLQSCSKFLLSYCQAVEVAAYTDTLHPLQVFKRAVFSTSSAVLFVSCWETASFKQFRILQTEKEGTCFVYLSHRLWNFTWPKDVPDITSRKKEKVCINDCHWNTYKIRALSSHYHKSIREESRKKLPVLGVYFP